MSMSLYLYLKLAHRPSSFICFDSQFLFFSRTADVLLSEVPFFFASATPRTPLDWNFTTTEQPGLNGRSVPFPRGFGLGGGTAMISGDPGWGWEALQPYIRKNERVVPPSDHHNTTGQFDPAVHGFNGINSVSLPGVPRATDSRVIQTTSELPDEFPFNLDYNSGYQLGIGWTQYTIGNGTRSSSQASYLGSRYIGRPNLHVLIHTHVTRILQPNTKFTNGQPTFGAVEFTQDAGATMHTLAPAHLKEIILSAGSVGTPHILLHSGIGDKAELTTLGITPRLHLPDVGKNLTDQPGWFVNFFVNDTDTIDIYFRNATFQAEALEEWQVNRTGFLSSGVASQVAFLRVPEEAGILDGEPCAGNQTAHYELVFTSGLFVQPIPAGNFFSIGTAGICPLSRGNITINSTNPLDAPLINPNFLSHPQDLAIMQYAAESAKKFVSAMAWDGYILGITVNITENDIRNGVSSVYHPVGTASMSPAGANWGVVNPDLKLKGAKGVRIVDASILPFVPAAHTQAAVYIFAERAADLIKADV